VLLWLVVLTPFRERAYYAKQGVKGPAFRPVVGDLPDIIKFRKEGKPFYELFRVRKATYGALSFNFLGPLFRIMCGDPAFAREVLVTHADAFTKPAFMRRVLGPLLGNGLVLSDGAVWKRHRALVGPAFHYARLAAMAPLMADAGVEAMGRWATRIIAAGGGPMEMDMHVELSTITLSIILEAAFGLRQRTDDGRVYQAIKLLLTVRVVSR
jgi:cytochrome P450